MMIKSKTLITVPVFNGEKFIGRTLDSCISQSVKTNVLVVDNVSTDKTRDIVNTYVKHYSNIQLVENTSNLGRVGNWNRCLELFEQSQSDYLKMVFCGDVLLETCIEEVEKVFTHHTNLAIVAWPYVFVDALKNTKRTPKILHQDIELNVEQLIQMDMYPSQFAGAIICHTFARFAIAGERFNECFLGMAEFTNKVPLKGNFYHINTPLSEFHLDSHTSYAKQFEYLFVLERAYTKAIGLENIKNKINENDYLRLKESLYKQLTEKFK
ncbi:glycosyltransferase family A protein [uncultured Paraglaciecola sp.]|uniref:glycosyltransferase family A protein n=1 Tax=uncultured Paraglaciecola sp. TaxID=1765024 RepID=UPI0025CD3442|nr:glycosyltransferase family A protein [uncultured Paraglaciecola sp.]